MNKFSGFFSIFVDKHKSIERFGIAFIALVIFGVFSFGGGIYSYIARKDALVGQISVFTPTFVSSQTHTPGSVSGIYVNNKRDRALVLLSFDNMSALPRDLNNYQVLVTGASSSADGNRHPLKVPVTGALFKSESDNIIGLVIDSPKPFRDEVLGIVLRTKVDLQPTSAREFYRTGANVKKFDTILLRVNLGLDSVPKVSALDDSNLDLRKTFFEIFFEKKQKVIKLGMTDSLLTMRKDLLSLEKLKSRFTCDSNVKVEECTPDVLFDGISLNYPGLPADMEGDRVVGTLPTEKNKDVQNTIALQTSHIVPGGYNFDFHSVNIYEGLISRFADPTQSFDSFIATMQSLEEPKPDKDLHLSWVVSNGMQLSDYLNALTGPAATTASNKLGGLQKEYESIINHYLSEKITYQFDYYHQLFLLDYQLNRMVSSSSVSTNPNTVVSF